jgi:hypothetical protein
MAMAMPLIALLAFDAGAQAIQADAAGRAGTSLDALLAFDDPRACKPGPVLTHLLETLLRDTARDPAVFGPVEVPPDYVPALGEPSLHRDGHHYAASVPVHGTWLGLPLDHITRRGWQGGTSDGFVIAVRSKPAVLAKALRKAGFDPPAAGRRLVGEKEGAKNYMKVTPSAAFASLDCS